ncbi:unnamed protein product [Caenorhabditis angaria]|uniref:Ubiquitin-like protease family profile domain-containing protein n=1 Tax=Caenorhabditis angaria TaxID=860376 RepID=A0A9P1N6K3_9PELO|nr:unnamed protein product [Caenorhabditis angaria]
MPYPSPQDPVCFPHLPSKKSSFTGKTAKSSFTGKPAKSSFTGKPDKSSFTGKTKPSPEEILASFSSEKINKKAKFASCFVDFVNRIEAKNQTFCDYQPSKADNQREKQQNQSKRSAFTALVEESSIVRSQMSDLREPVKEQYSKSPKRPEILLGGARTTRTAETKEFEIIEKNQKTIIVRLRVPNKAAYKCPISGCFMQSVVGIGAEPNRYMVKHVKDHNLKIEFTYQCDMCEAICPERYTYPTRSVSKQLSASKEPKPDLNPRLSISKPKSLKSIKEEASSAIETKSPRRSLAPIFSSAKPIVRSSLAPSIPIRNQGVIPASRSSIDKPDYKRLSSSSASAKQTKEEDERCRQVKQTKRASLSLSWQPAKKEERGEKIKDQRPKEKNNEGIKKTSKIEPEIVTLEEDKEPAKNRLNIWSLTHEFGNEAWLDSDILTRFIEDQAKEHPRFSVLDPLLWHYCKDSVEEGARFITGIMSNERTHIFPICEHSHWVLIVSSSRGWYFLDPLGSDRTMPRKILEFSKFLKGDRLYYKTSPPKQKDTYNCGVHVCLMAKCIMTEDVWYTEADICMFRLNMLTKLRNSNKYSLFEEKIDNQIMEVELPEPEPEPEISQEPEYPELDITQDLTLLDSDSESPSREDELLNETASEEVADATLDSPKPEIPGLMDTILEKPAFLEQPQSRRQARKARTQPIKIQKKLKGKPEELIDQVRVWFTKQMDDYEKDGKSFQRLEWIADALAASIHQASVGDTEAIGKIVKRCPPPERSAGDMCTQTEKPKHIRPPKPSHQTSPVEEDHIMAQYAKNRSKTYCKITRKESKQCEISIATVESHFNKTTQETNVSQEILTEMSSEVPKTNINPSIVEEFRPSEIKNALKATKDTKPGVDGVHYHHLQWFDPDHTLLCKLYNACKEQKKIPGNWKEAETILIYKGANSDPAKPDNWRPISLMPTIYKLYSSLWNRRIRSVGGIMSKCQRGFQERDGSNESIGILRTAIDSAKGTGGNVSIAWLDLTNAFGSVPHELIRQALKAFGFPEELVEIVSDMYDGACIRVRTKTETTSPILIKSGVKQGDPISPTLFNMCLELVIRRHLKKARGHKCLKTNIKTLAFADDMAILANSPNQLQKELEDLDKDCTSLNLIFKPSKCASLTISEGKLKQRPLHLKGQPIRTLNETGTYKYLDFLQEVAEKETGTENMNIDQIADYLSNKTQINKKAFGFSVFTRVRDICKSLSKLKDSPLHLLEFTAVDQKLAIKIQATADSEPVIVTEKNLKKLQQTLKAQVLEALLHRFTTEKEFKSKVVQVIQQEPRSNAFVRTGDPAYLLPAVLQSSSADDSAGRKHNRLVWIVHDSFSGLSLFRAADDHDPVSSDTPLPFPNPKTVAQ